MISRGTKHSALHFLGCAGPCRQTADPQLVWLIHLWLPASLWGLGGWTGRARESGGRLGCDSLAQGRAELLSSKWALVGDLNQWPPLGMVGQDSVILSKFLFSVPLETQLFLFHPIIFFLDFNFQKVPFVICGTCGSVWCWIQVPK
jgi:hypothetical protein